MTEFDLKQIAAERKRINKLYKEAVEAERIKRKPLEDAIRKALPQPSSHFNTKAYYEQVAKRLAILHDRGELTFKSLDEQKEGE